VIRALYSLLMWMAQPLLVRKLRRRAVAEPGYGHAIEQRFGDYRGLSAPHRSAGEQPSAEPAPWLWVHAVSLGEARAAEVLVRQLRAAIPGMRLLLTHGTATGWEQGKALLLPGDLQVWQPWDSAGAVRRFLERFQPRIGLLMETEVWPNLVRACAQAGVPLCLVNARLSAQSLRKANRIAWLARPAYAGLTAVWAQTEDDAARLRELGAPVQVVTGNMKFDATPDAQQLQAGRHWRAASDKPVVLFASSREGEEQLWLAALRKNAAATEAIQWLIVPRHPQRFDAVEAVLQDGGLRVSRRSTWQDAPAPAQVWLGDSLGEMALYFGMADLVLLGGSFATLGGQNLIEAAACSCPVVMGPHTFNFAEAAELARAAGAAFEVPDMQSAMQRVDELLNSETALADARAAALAWSQAHRGAAERTVAAVLPLLKGRI
jgi:3-deoxy-D-manno-octulosonic-acid transferase